MELADATNTNRKFGKPRDLLCALTPNKGPTSELANLNHALVRPKQLTGVQWRSKDGLCLASRRTAGPSAAPDFLSITVASVNFMRLSLRRAAYVAAGRAVK
jgi:hypothetical protein